jgi:dynein heavy chain 1, cytosolic
VHDLREKHNTLTGLLEEMKTCQFEASAFSGHMASFQAVLDDLNLAEYANLPAWVAGLSKKVTYF